MITQISSLNVEGKAVRDPRRKSQHVRFNKSAMIPYTGGTYTYKSEAEKDALWNSIAIIAGSIIFTIGYLMISAIKHPKV